MLLQGNENYTGIAARDTAGSLRVLTSAVRGVAATSGDRELQDSIVDHARDVMDKSANLIEEAKKAVAHPQNPDNQTRLAQVLAVLVHCELMLAAAILLASSYSGAEFSWLLHYIIPLRMLSSRVAIVIVKRVV